ncbi:hypothetical protein M426DRAFT_17495 [Hypoxylon sp. CI-4A]|nr:hypothetical protein M426DRAFT_17495 [Hypoxylon sp. CI-4A]
MAYPPGEGEEEVINYSKDANGLAHCDLHGSNLMFDGLDETLEHNLTPKLKIIDFGFARANYHDYLKSDKMKPEEYDDILGLSRYNNDAYSNDQGALRNPGVEDNIIAVASLMTQAITDRIVFDLKSCRDAMLMILPNVDKDLTLLIQRCLAVDHGNMPRLDELLNTCLENVRTRDAAWYAKHYPRIKANETDEAVRKIIQECIFDAEDSDGLLSLDSSDSSDSLQIYLGKRLHI